MVKDQTGKGLRLGVLLDSHCTEPHASFLWVVGPLQDGFMLLLCARPNRVPRSRAQPPGARWIQEGALVALWAGYKGHWSFSSLGCHALLFAPFP